MKTAQWLAMTTSAWVAAGAANAQAQTQAPASAAVPATVIAWAPSCAPTYPAAAQRVGAQGTTAMAVHLDEAGKVVAVDIVHASGPTREHRMLDAEAVRAIKTCPFTTARDATGKPIPSVLTLTQEWHVENTSGDAKSP